MHLRYASVDRALSLLSRSLSLLSRSLSRSLFDAGASQGWAESCSVAKRLPTCTRSSEKSVYLTCT